VAAVSTFGLKAEEKLLVTVMENKPNTDKSSEIPGLSAMVKSLLQKLPAATVILYRIRSSADSPVLREQ
jgi:hypothetical protein